MYVISELRKLLFSNKKPISLIMGGSNRIKTSSRRRSWLKWCTSHPSSSQVIVLTFQSFSYRSAFTRVMNVARLLNSCSNYLCMNYILLNIAVCIKKVLMYMMFFVRRFLLGCNGALKKLTEWHLL